MVGQGCNAEGVGGRRGRGEGGGEGAGVEGGVLCICSVGAADSHGIGLQLLQAIGGGVPHRGGKGSVTKF